MAEPITILECVHDFISTCMNESIYSCLLPVLQHQSRSFEDMSVQASEFAVFKFFYMSLISSDRIYLFLHLLCPFSDQELQGTEFVPELLSNLNFVNCAE